MSITPLLHRHGSLLMPAGSGWLPASAPIECSVAPQRAIRKSYSQYQVLSPTVGVVMVPNRQLEALLAWADTEPGVVDVSIVNRAITFFDRGRDRTTHIPLMVAHADGSISYWDVTSASLDGRHPPSCELAKREFADAGNAGYRPMSWTFFMQHEAELLSRRAWQNILYSGSDRASADVESQLLLALTRGPASVSELAAQTGSDDFSTLFAVARQWRAGRIWFATRNAFPGMRLQVSLGGAYGR
jgi:hypothetical protein